MRAAEARTQMFGLRHRNQWFRRRLVAFLRNFVHVTLGSSINRKIIDFVTWLTCEEQVAEYVRAFRCGSPFESG
jgi:hypothetical protein